MRGAGAGGAGGAGGGTGLTARTGGFTGFAARTGLPGLAAVRADAREDSDPEGRRRSVWALFFPIGAGLRAEVRDFVTRRDFAIGGILASQIGSPEGTVTNRVADGQDLRRNPPLLLD